MSESDCTKQIKNPHSHAPAGIEVRGEVLLAILGGIRSIEMDLLQILGRHGISQPEASHWYPLSSLVAAWDEIGARWTPTALYAMGSKVAGGMEVVETLGDFRDFTQRLSEIYAMIHRGGGIGKIQVDWEGERRVRVVMNTPYPCDFERGVLYGFARLLPPPGSDQVYVEHDDGAPCRKLGESSCTYRLRW